MDIGAGASYNALDFFLTAHQGLFVLTPEPTSIQNTIQFIKAIYLRKLKQILKQEAFSALSKEVTGDAGAGSAVSPLDMVDRVIKMEPEHAQYLEEELRSLTFRMVLNQYRPHVDSQLGKKIETICNRHFFSHFRFLGNISYNERVTDSIIAKKIFVVKYPYTPTSDDLKNLASRMAADTVLLTPLKETHAQV